MYLYTIPALFCPFSTYIHPLVNEIEDHTNQWILDYRLIETYETFTKYKDYRFAKFIARSFPFGDYADICAWSDFNTLLFIIDDKFDDQEMIKDKRAFLSFERDFVEVLVQNKKCTIEKDGPILSALSDIWQRLLLRTSEAWRQKFIKCVKDMFSGLGWQFELVMDNRQPELSDYIGIRQYLGAAHMSTDSLELTGKILLPENVYDNPVVHRLTETCRNTICFANDLFSLAKETEESQNGGEFNLVTILKRKNNLTIEEAIKAAADFHDNLVREFIDLSGRAYIYDASTNEMLAKYIQALGCLMIANIVWSTTETTRYPHIYDVPETNNLSFV